MDNERTLAAYSLPTRRSGLYDGTPRGRNCPHRNIPIAGEDDDDDDDPLTGEDITEWTDARLMEELRRLNRQSFDGSRVNSTYYSPLFAEALARLLGRTGVR